MFVTQPSPQGPQQDLSQMVVVPTLFTMLVLATVMQLVCPV